MTFDQKRLNYIIKPYEDEILYGQIARFLSHTLSRRMSSSLLELFNRTNYIATIDLPSHLDELFKNCYHRIVPSVEAMIDRYTLYPFYHSFLRVYKREIILKGMKSGSGSRIHVTAGINTSFVQRIRYPKFCPQCVSEMRSENGEAYWKRVHQIPGILVCPVHNAFLIEYTPSVSELSYSKFLTAENVREESGSIALNKNSMLLMVSRWLEDSLHQRTGFDINTVNYKEQLQARYAKGLKMDYRKLLEDMLKFYGQECLSFYFPPKPQLLNWVPMMVRRPVFNFSPLRHVLLYNFINQQQYQLSLFGNPVPVEQWKCINAACKHYEKSAFGTITTFYDSTVKRNVSIVSCECGMKYKAGPKGKYKTGIRIYTIQDYGDVWINKVHEEYKKGKSIAAIAKTMKTGWRAINRLLNEKNEKPDLKFEYQVVKCRTLWEALLNSFDQSKIMNARKANNQLYKWLYNNDLSWLKVINKLHASRGKPPQLKLDWEHIDANLVSRISLATAQLKEQNYKGRITKALISKLIKKEKNYLALNASRLPLSSELLTKVTETVEESQKRRSLAAIRELVEKGENITVLKVTRTARFINPTENIMVLIENEITKLRIA